MNKIISESPTEQQQTSVGRRSFAAMAGVLLSRASGVVRTVIINAVFGANVKMDAFNTAFRFPNSLRDLFADGALSAAFMKVLVDEIQNDNGDEKALISIVMGFFLSITLTLSLIAVIFAKPFIQLVSTHTFAQSGGLLLATHMFQMLAFYLPITMLNAVVMAVLGVHNMNFRAMNGSLFLSVGMISGALGLAPIFHYLGSNSIYGLTIGALLGACFQLIYQIWPLFKLKLIKRPCFPLTVWRHSQALKNMLIMMAPRALGQGASTLALMINTFFAIQIGQGAMTYIATTVIIVQVPIGLFGVATGFASLPVLTDAINRKAINQFSQLFVESIDITLWLALFTVMAFALFIVPAYTLIFQHGKIHYFDTLQNCLAICAYASGILFSAGSKILINGLYVLNRTRYIVYNSLLYLLLNAALTAMLAPKFGLIGLGLAYGFASAGNFWLNYYLVYYAFRQGKYGYSPYSAGGKMYLNKLVAFSLLTFVTSLIGVWLVEQFWMRYHAIFNMNLTAIMAIAILIFAGGIFATIVFILTYYSGPPSLQRICQQCILKLRGIK